MTSSWSGNGWTLSVDGDQVLLDRGGERRAFAGAETASLSLTRSWWRWQLRCDSTPLQRLRGLSSRDATTIRAALARLGLDAACAWSDRVAALIEAAQNEQRWIPREPVDALLAKRPSPSLASTIAANQALHAALDERERAALARLGEDLPEVVASVNESIMASELVSRQDFFDRVERSPLTEEQARVVVCFDNRVQVIAAAGSGKTSVMVARAAYAVERGFVAPDRILLLAFNKDAAAELQSRVDARLEALGISASLRASTFHSFGLDVIGQATGERPRLAPWVESSGQETRAISDIVDGLRDSSETFRHRWDLYRLLFAAAPTAADGGDPDGYDGATDTRRFLTFRSELVRSHGELMIANWLYLNGIRYEYERPYVHNVATAEHSQYRPDFFYPDIDAWHEHWALDHNGLPPSTTEFAGYADGMAWKKDVHLAHDTILVESTWAEIIDGSGFGQLQERLEQLGLTFDWNPDRPIPPAAEPIKHEDLIGFVRTFMAHVKSNSLTSELVADRLETVHRHLGGYRTNLFVGMFWEIYNEWERHLRADNLVDFEDMLTLAAEHLEAGTFDPDYDLIMVDELQDASNARARLLRGLLRKPGRFLLAVGDDWQSINRFAGADISVMTNFDDWFGAGPTLRLETTFRCTQSICDAASTFVTKNPRQLPKTVRSVQEDDGPPVAIMRTGFNGTADALAAHLEELSAAAVAGHIAPGPDGLITVKVLGRYRFEKRVMPNRNPPGISVQFLTVHRSKGLEADYIIIPRMAAGKYGFPNGIVDDPLLDLVMAAPDTFSHAEERRLLYVALTRARRAVLLMTEHGRESPFVKELIDDGLAVLEGDTDMRPCVRCGIGTLVTRHGQFGYFQACSRYPACTYTQNLTA